MSLTRRVANALATSKRAMNVQSYPQSAAVSSGMASIFLDDLDRDWAASATAYRCVQAIAGNASSLALQVMGQDDVPVANHWLTRLWEQPNPILSRRILAEILWARLETRGRAFVFIDRGESGEGEPQSMWPILHNVKPVIDRIPGTVMDEVIGYQVHLPGGRRLGLLPSEVLWLRYPDPDSTWGSLSPLGAAGHAVELDAYAREWQRSEFRNGAKPKHVVYLGDLSPSAHDKAVEAWKSDVEGATNAGKSLLLSGPVKSDISRLTLTPEEMSWLDTRNVTSQEVMLAFGVPKDYLLGGATYENRAASRTTLWSDTIIPKLEIVASEMTRQMLVREAGRRVRFDTDDVDALQEGADAKAKRTGDLTGLDVMTLDEARAEVGLDPLPGYGHLTLTAYRTMIAAQAQAALLAGAIAPEDRRRATVLPGVTPGALGAAPAAAPFILPSGRRKHGPSASKILAEYDRLEVPISKATGRLAKRQQAVVLTNAERLLGGKSKKAQAWLRGVEGAALMYAATALERGSEAALEAEATLRASVDDLFDAEHWAGETRIAMEGPVGAAWETGSALLASSLGLDFNDVDLLVLTAMDGRLDELSDKVTDTTRRVLEDRVLLQGVANGESIDQLKARIRSVFSDLSSWRATMIARTETVGGFNKASLVTAEASGVVVEREWLATNDTRTRDTHRATDGDVVKGFTARYSNGCLHPGDPTAPPEETILCRCVELYVTED